MSFTNWFDIYGWLHLRPNPLPEQTENAPTFTGTWITSLGVQRKLTEKICWNFIASVNSIYFPLDGWKTTPISKKLRFSHDNMTGVVCGLLSVIKYAKQTCNEQLLKIAKIHLDNVPIFHKQRLHPRDIVFYGYAKYPILFFIFLWIPSITMVISCWQIFKTRPTLYFRIKYLIVKKKFFPLTRKIIKSDGKILSLIRCHAANLKLTWWICDLIIRKKRNYSLQTPKVYLIKLHTGNSFWYWGKWENIFYEYFKNYNHLNVVEIKKVEELWKT